MTTNTRTPRAERGIGLSLAEIKRITARIGDSIPTATDAVLEALALQHERIVAELRREAEEATQLRTERDALWRALEPFTKADVCFYGDGSISILMDDAEALRAAHAALASPKEAKPRTHPDRCPNCGKTYQQCCDAACENGSDLLDNCCVSCGHTGRPEGWTPRPKEEPHE